MAMTSNQRNISVFLATTGMTGIAAAAYLGLTGVNEESLGVALRLSARIAFIVLIAVFIARPLRQLVATPATTTLLRNRRLLGITFAGIHSAHLGLLIFWANVNPDFDLSLTRNHLGVVTYLVIYAMLVTSFDRPARALGPRNWKILHKVGLFWLFWSFSLTQLPRSLDALDEANWWLISLIAIALVIRLTAFFAKRRPGTRPN
jgi:DMSO/TMAO reductase YedYZ heme-binding membrane subunit